MVSTKRREDLQASPSESQWLRRGLSLVKSTELTTDSAIADSCKLSDDLSTIIIGQIDCFVKRNPPPCPKGGVWCNWVARRPEQSTDGGSSPPTSTSAIPTRPGGAFCLNLYSVISDIFSIWLGTLDFEKRGATQWPRLHQPDYPARSAKPKDTAKIGCFQSLSRFFLRIMQKK